ncbi:unnamed protein product [Amoebophrya sp. A25]|nr:unnamed protein product [Amoebophrya sp. A25]|eukprot:GSA25T00011429001.1
MSCVEFQDSEGNVCLLTVDHDGAFTVLVEGSTASYVLESPPRVTLNHLTQILSDGVREFRVEPNYTDVEEVYRALRALLGARFEEYNRDLAIAETEDGELILVTDASAFLTEEEYSFLGSESGDSDAATADEYDVVDDENEMSSSSNAVFAPRTRVRKDATVLGCHVRCESGALVRTPQPDTEKVCDKEAYCAGVLKAEAPVDVELLLQNKGKEAWPANTCLACVSGSGFGVPAVELDSVNPSEVVSVTMKGLQKETMAESYWSLTDGVRFFGPLIYMTQI